MPLSAQQSFRHIVLSAVVAGLITGLVVTLVQVFTTVPLIAKAEVYEKAAEAQPSAESVQAAPADVHHDHAAHDHGAGDHHGASTWEPKDGFERTFYTGVATVLAAIGYALLLGACFSQMQSVGWLTGLGLGLAGFIVFQLAPAIGLPPEPPGAPVAELMPRQLWWFGTVVATALALGAWFYARNHSKLIWIPVGVLLLLLPHLIGAPQSTEGQTVVPQELARNFAIAALLTAAVFWLVLGGIEGYLFGKFSRRA